MEGIRAKLLDIQVREGLTDGQMAIRLGIVRSYWHGIRSGKLTLSAKVAMRAVGQWPELSMDLLTAAADSAA